MGRNSDKRDRINAFKNELKSYRQLKKDYRYYGERLMVINQKMFGFGGPSYDGLPSIQHNPFAPNPLTILAERKDKVDQQLKIVVGRLDNIDKTLSLINDRDRKDLESIYIYGHNIEEVAMRNNISHRMQRYYMDQAIYDALVKVGQQWIDGEFDKVG